MSAEHIVFMDLPLVFRLDIARNSLARPAVPLERRLRRAARSVAPR